MYSEGQKKDVRQCQKRFLAFLCGFFLNSSAHTSVLNLQSSVNVKDGLGTISLAVTYGVCCVTCIFFSPMLLRTFGPKKCLLISEFTYFIYVLANLYPEFYTLIPAAVLVGIGEAMLWVSASLFDVHYATQYSVARMHPTKDNDFYVNLFSGYFFTVVQICQIVGNLISYVVLYAFDGSSSEEDEFTTTVALTTTGVQVNQYQFCGAQDCQDQDVVGDSIAQYVPANSFTIVFLISVLAVLCLIGQILHCFILPAHIDRVGEIVKEDTATKGNENPAFDDQESISSSIQQSAKDYDSHRDGEDSGKSKDFESPGIWAQYQKALKETGSQVRDLRQVLLTPMCLYLGLFEGFVFSELTRAYSSCVLGVATVGLCMATYGLSDAILSWIVGKFGKKWGRTPFFIASCLLDIGTFSYCLFWNPNLESSWSIYLAFFSLGATDGVWQTLLNVAHLEYFPSSHDVAISIWNCWVTMGFTLQFAWSTSLCVYVKLYIQLSLLVASVVCYGFADRIDRKKRRQDVTLEGTRL